MTDRLKILAMDRQEGKTSAAMDWLCGGERAPGYPGWSRVLIVMNRGEVERLRRAHRVLLEDFDRRVYSWDEWSRAVGVSPETEVCIDNAELFLARIPGRLSMMTMTAARWTES